MFLWGTVRKVHVLQLRVEYSTEDKIWCIVKVRVFRSFSRHELYYDGKIWVNRRRRNLLAWLTAWMDGTRV